MMMRQLGLLPAGCQPWNSNMVAGTRSKFAYCSTMAVYIYEATQQSSPEYKLTSINAEHTKTITSIAWNVKQSNLIATCGGDLKILIWDVRKHKVIAQLPNLKVIPRCIDWVASSEQPVISYIGAAGCLETWSISTGKVSMLKNISCAGGSDVSTFKWHHTRLESVAFGHCDGSVSLFLKDSAKKKIVRFHEDSDIDDRVVLLSWDPLSDEYLLAANKLTGVRLIDTSNASVITAFCLPSRAVTTSTFSWVNSAPGMFLTGDRETGVLRLWTVGQEQPLESFRVKPMGFNGIHVLDRAQGCHPVDDNLACGLSRRKTLQLQPSNHSVPPATVVCTFRDGGVGLYDLQKKKWLFLKDQGHIETIFDCKFKPDNPKVLATASFDGTIKIWSTTDLSAIKASAGNEGVIYSISWAPENLNCICCGTRRNGVFVWDFNKGKVIKRFSDHRNFAVFCVAWNQRDSQRIASASEDCCCVVRSLDGDENQRLSHSAPVYGCDWSVFDKTMLATACEDGLVRVWNVTKGSRPKCLHELKGHSEKVFHVRWHPLLENMLCSGSDDGTIRIWSNAKSVGVLTGHTGRIRGLSWNYEIPHLIVSGSWDSTIRLWDARQSELKCLGVINDHGADVYGLTSHPSTPFMMASTSRDSTVRLWSLAPILTILFAKVIAGHPLEDILCTPQEGMKMQSGLRLAGKMSKQIAGQLKQRSKSSVVKLRWFSELFCATPSLENLWDVACYHMGAKETSLSPDYKVGVLHRDHLVKYKAADAQESELSSTTKLQSSNRQQEVIMEKVAAVHLKLGNLRKHCDILKLLGRWETALSLAPGVSVEYWRSLAQEYAELLETSGDSEYLCYRVAIGDPQKCIQNLMRAGDFEDALLIAQSALEGRMPSPAAVNLYKDLPNGDGREEKDDDRQDHPDIEALRSKCVKNLSRASFSSGDPYRAAAYYFSNGNIAGAIDCLVKGNELLLALCLGQALKSSTVEAAVIFSRKLEGQDHFFFAIEILKSFTIVGDEALSAGWNYLHASCARFDGDEAHRENLHKHAGVASPDKYLEDGERHRQSGQPARALQCFLLSSQRHKGLEIGLELLCRNWAADAWSLTSKALVEALPVFCVSSSVLMQSDVSRLKNELLAISAFVGALRAVKFGFLSIVAPLLEHAIAMGERLEMMPSVENSTYTFPLSSSELRKYLNSWKDFSSKTRSGKVASSGDTDGDSYLATLLQRVEIEPSSVRSRETITAGSSLPSHSDVHISSLTNKRINGPTYCLEDGSTVISLNEAIMWARVNEFSPIGSGKRIVPF